MPTRGYRLVAAAVVSLAGLALAGVFSYMTFSTPVIPKAYELSLQGTFHSQQQSAPSLARAVESFEQAIALDPAFAPAYAGLARAKFSQDLFGGTGFLTQADHVRRAAVKARNLDPNLAEAHDGLGLVLSFYDWDWNGAESALRRAIALDPGLASAHSHFSFLLQALGRFDDAVTEASRAVALEPRSPLTLSDEGRALFRARRYQEAEDRYRRALALDRGFGPALDRLLQLYVVQRRFPEVQRIVDSLEHAPPYESPISFRAWLDVPAGNIQSARTLLARLDDRPSGAHPAVVLGDHDTAFAILERAVRTRTIYPFSWADPSLDPLRKDPRFAQLVHAMGLPVDRLVAIGGSHATQ